ncbi:IdeS/Mac family cysteine endopeptidase [Ornithobacterium rhinotracheale]
MKKIKFLLSLSVMLFLVFSCSDDENSTPEIKKKEVVKEKGKDEIPSTTSDETGDNTGDDSGENPTTETPTTPNTDNGTNPEDTYRLSFNAAGGTGAINDIFAKPGEVVSLPDPRDHFKRFNYEARGGYNDSPEEGAWIKHGREFKMPSHDVTLYVAWQVIDKSLLNEPSKKYKNQDVFAEGVDIPQANDWVPIRYSENKTVVWDKTKKWYDTDQANDPLCWAATTANVLHWWMDQNKENIEEYYRLKGKTLEKSGMPREYKDTYNSEIYKYLKKHWPSRGNRVQPAFNWFLSDSSVKIPGGGFFEEVFKNKNIANGDFNVDAYRFTKFCDQALSRGDVMSIGIQIAGGGHAIVVWGAHFDEKGFVDALYYTNSNDTKSNTTEDGRLIGLKRTKVTYKGDKIYTDGSTGEPTIEVTEISSLSLGKQIWKEYFAKQR